MFTKYLFARKAARATRENAPNAQEQDEPDLLSFVQKVANVLLWGVLAMYRGVTNLVPAWRDDMTQDVREFCSPIATYVERSKAVIKLERMSPTSIILLLSILYTASFTCLASAIVIAVSWSRFQDTTSTASDSACDIAFAAMIIEGICRTAAVAMLTFLTIFFPFRLLRFQAKNHGMAFQYEQVLLIMFFILLMGTPGMSIYSPIMYWQQYSFALEHGPLLFHNNTFNLTLGESYVASFFSRTSTSSNIEIASTVMSVLLVSYYFLYLGLTAHAFGITTTSTDPRTFWATVHCLLLNSNRRVWCVALAYSAIFIPLVVIFHMLPSVVPLVGIITVFKSVNKLSPHYDDGLGFQRAMVVSAQFVYEAIAFGYLHWISNSVRCKLKMTPYEQARPKHLGFRYYSSNKRMAIFFAVLSSIIVVSCVQESYSNNELIMGPNRDLVSSSSPLRQVGISFFTLGFGPFYLLLTSFLFAFAYAYLPPDSQHGIAAFFCGGAKHSLKRDMDRTHVYLATCKDVAAWREMQQRSSDSSSSTAGIADIESNADTVECNKYQVNACVFCLETEILLLNLTYLSYLSPDEVKKSSQANKFRSVNHIFNKESDIQCYVFERRTGEIFVTFRGTSSNTNMWQDLDYFTTPAQMRPDEVEPLVDDLDPFQRACAGHVPLVHRGFYKAYLTIREKIVSVVCSLITATDGGVVMYCCGHSLGGALATLFATDVGLRFQTDKCRLLGVHLSTFGSPRVGNFAYTSRVARLVGTIHRFVVGGDPIPKLPPAIVFGEQTKLGYQHVGVEVLLDVERVTLLIDPLFIEREIQHGWGGYSPQRHLTGTYVLSLLLWSARVHAKKFVPNWWLPVVNHVLRAEKRRLRVVKRVYPMLTSSIVDQLEKEGAVTWTEDMRAFQTVGCDTGGEEDESESTQRKNTLETVLATLGFNTIDELRNYLAKEN